MKDYGNGIQTDLLIIKKFGWKRIVRNKERFGWELHKADEHTEITEDVSYEGRISGDTLYIEEKVSTKSKVRVWLSFYRLKDNFLNLRAIKPLEIIYNLIFFIRRILAFFVPALFIATLVCMFLNFDFDEITTKVAAAWGITTIVWLLFILIEGILSRIAGLILKRK